jgi:putative aminopeptidase FrvX
MVNSSNEMGWRQSVVLSVTVAAEVAEMSAARAAVTVKVFIVIEVDVCCKGRSKSLKQLKYVDLIFA